MNNFLQNPVNSEQEKQILFYHKIFYFAQSTAFIVPIFYIYIQEKLGISFVQILQISALYSFLPIFLQLPCGIVADKIGNKINLYLCLILQLISCLSLILINGVLAFHLYLISINLAQSISS